MTEANDNEIDSQIEIDIQNENEPEATPETFNNSFDEQLSTLAQRNLQIKINLLVVLRSKKQNSQLMRR